MAYHTENHAADRENLGRGRCLTAPLGHGDSNQFRCLLSFDDGNSAPNYRWCLQGGACGVAESMHTFVSWLRLLAAYESPRRCGPGRIGMTHSLAVVLLLPLLPPLSF